MKDPLRPVGAANVGAAGLARTSPTGTRWQLGEVVEYNSATHTSTVRTHAGQPLRDVPQIKPTGGSYDHLATGTTVVVSWDLGMPAIIGCIDFVGLQQSAIVPPSLTGVEGFGDADPTQPTTGGNSFKPPLAPTDMSQGDWAHVGAHGNHVAVMAGGLTLMGSPTAQVRSFGTSGVLQHIARRMESVSDFGQWRVENDRGRTSFVLRAGSTQATETGLDEENWTIRLDLGSTGDVLDFRISEPSGRVLFRLHAGSDGRVQLYGDGGVDISSGDRGTKEARSDVAGDRRVVIAGADSTNVSGGKTEIVDGGLDVQIGEDSTKVVGGDETSVVAGSRVTSAGEDSVDVVTGDLTSRVGKTATMRIGDTATLSAGKDLKVIGEAAIDVTATGRVRVTGSQVTLGPNGRHPLPKFDVFLRDLAEFLAHLFSAIGCLTPSNPAGLASQLALMQKFAILVTQGFPYESFKVKND